LGTISIFIKSSPNSSQISSEWQSLAQWWTKMIFHFRFCVVPWYPR
jgi:hypothetical protein